MSIRNVWFLGLVVLALIFGGVINTYAQLDSIEAYDVDGRATNDEYSIRGVRVLLQGDCNTEKGDVGILQMAKQDGTWLDIKKTTSFASGGNELDGLTGTSITPAGHVIANIDGEYSVTFVIPLDILTAAPPTGQTNGMFWKSQVRFKPVASGGTALGEAQNAPPLDYWIQTPRFNDAKLNVQLEDVVKPGDMIEFSLEMESFDAGDPTISGKEIRLLTMLPDLSELDSEFNYTGGSLYAAGTPAQKWARLKALATAVKAAVNKGRLIIEQRDEDYTIKYFISQNNTKSPGFKKVIVYAIDYPAVLDTSNIDTVFSNFGLSFANLHLAAWETAARTDALNPPQSSPPSNGGTYPINNSDQDNEIDADLINYDGTPPNFDFAMVNPFNNPPKAIWNDVNGNGQIDPAEWDHVSYVYKKGDTVSIWIQIDPHDLNVDELRNLDDWATWVLPGDTQKDMRTENLTIIGDLSGLMDPAKISSSDANGNGIPDDAEVLGVANLGTNGTDDDLDGDGEYADDEDGSSNGFYEPFIYQFTFQVTDKFRGASDRGLVTAPFRFYIKDSVGNVKHYSAWRETYNTVDKKWNEATLTNWVGPNGRSNDFNLVGGARFPVNLDNPQGDEQIYTDNEATSLGPLSFNPVPGLFPQWTNGFKIVNMWDKPWMIAIDGSAPTVSVISELRMNVKTEEPAPQPLNGTTVSPPDPSVAMGAAVVPDRVGYEPIDYVPTVIDLTSATQNLLTNTQFGGNFIYEVSGNELNLVRMQINTPSDNDVNLIKFMISETGAAGTFVPMKGVIKGDADKGIIDFAGNVTDAERPGVSKQSAYHDGFDGNDDKDEEADFSDKEVMAAMTHPGTDGVDNDADGLTDAEDVDIDGNSTEIYDPSRDEDEDGVMDEDAFIVRVKPGQKFSSFTFDPVVLVRTLKLQPGKPYVIKALAIDNSGASNIDASAPLYIVFNVTGKGITAPTGTAKAALQTKASVAIATPTIPENMEYLLSSTITGAVNTVTLQYSNNKRDWVTIDGTYAIPNPDEVTPFRATWKPIVSQINAQLAAFGGYKAGDPLYIRASGQKLGKLGKFKIGTTLTLDPALFTYYDPVVSASDAIVSSEPDITIAITDSSAPVMVVYSAGGDDNLFDGALLPVSKDVILRAKLVSPVDAVIAIDSSSNILAGDLAIAKDAAKQIIDHLNSSIDRVGIISWDDNVDFTRVLTYDYVGAKAVLTPLIMLVDLQALMSPSQTP